MCKGSLRFSPLICSTTLLQKFFFLVASHLRIPLLAFCLLHSLGSMGFDCALDVMCILTLMVLAPFVQVVLDRSL
uniref:Uncharacterized protein n=1 Tax=Arundo donax TaxID=35708 RepID=A0A0A8YTH2_ARUDO